MKLSDFVKTVDDEDWIRWTHKKRLYAVGAERQMGSTWTIVEYLPSSNGESVQSVDTVRSRGSAEDAVREFIQTRTKSQQSGGGFGFF